jgi:hypothetical protein
VKRLRFDLAAFPSPASRAAYEDAAREIEAALSRLPSAIAVYRLGSVSVPGISDIDRLVVVDGTARVADVWSALSDDTRTLAMHAPFLVDRATFANHRWFADIQPLDLVWGEPVDIAARPDDEYARALIAVEGLTVTLLKLVKLSTTHHAKVRPLLCELNTLKFDLEIAGLTPTDAPNAWAFAGDVRSLRTDWWSIDAVHRNERFRPLLSAAPRAVEEALRRLGRPFDGHLAEAMRLRDEWGTVTLIAGGSSRGRMVRSPLGRSRRVGEAIWRAFPRSVVVPPGVLSLLAGTDGAHDEFRAERERIVARYAAVASSAQGYSSIGQARVFRAHD